MSENKRKETNRTPLVVPEGPEKATAADLINNLNNDCLVKVFEYLPMYQRLTVETVCKRWKDVVKLAWDDIEALNFNYGATHFPLPYINRRTQYIGNILMRCRGHLKELDLGFSYDSKLLPLVGQHCCNLTRLKIDLCNRSCVKSLPQMQRLKCFEMRGFSRKVRGNFFRTLPNETLTELHLWGDHTKPPLPHVFVGALQNLEKLTALTLNTLSLKDQVMKVISHKSNLTFLSLANCKVNDELLYFNLLVNLEHLNISLLRVNDNFLLELSENNKKLKYLNISNTWGSSDNGLRNLQKLCQLEELIVNNVYGISDAGLSGMHNLHKLECEDCFDVHDEGIIKLMEHAPYLEYLVLADSGVSGEVLEAAKRITKQRTNNLLLNVRVNRRVGRFSDIGGNHSHLLSVDMSD